MIDKSIPAGWVVQVAIPAKSEARQADAPWRPPVMLVSATTFEYFNVAIAAADKAMAATTNHLAQSAEPKAGVMSVVRKLSSGEIAALSLQAGEVKPA
jgi:hypothetical protein